MDIVLGVSMTPTAVRMVLVEGENADGVTVDRDSVDIAGRPVAPGADSADQVIAAILGTRESAVESGHHLKSTGVAWTDHAAAARLSQMLRAHGVDDVVLVSELHAASALAQAIGAAVGYERTALLFLERTTATLAVVRTADGVVVRVDSRSLHTVDAVAELRQMVAGSQTANEPPQAVFMVGSGVDIAALRPAIVASTSLPVHAPDDGELALARGAALASASAPRYEASTVGLAPGLLPAEDTQAAFGATQLAAAGYMAPLGYSAVPDADDDLPGFEAESATEDPYGPDESVDPESKPFLLVGSALSTVFVVGVAALAISLAVVVRPAVDQRPDPVGNAVLPTGQAPVAGAGEALAPETIQAPIPVVQQAPRTLFVAPGLPLEPAAVAPAPAPAPVPASAPAPALPPVAAIPAPAPAAPVTVTAAPAAPAPVIPPIVVSLPAMPPLLTSIFQAPAGTPTLRYPSTAQSSPSSPPTTDMQPTAESQSPVTATSSPPSLSSPPPSSPPSSSTSAPVSSASSDSASPSDTSYSGDAGESDSTGSGTEESPLWPLSPSG